MECAHTASDSSRKDAVETAPEMSHATTHATDRVRRALFQIDPGWPFVITGLGLLVAGVLIPAQRDLHELRGSLEVHQALLEHSERRLDAYDMFVSEMQAGQPQLVRRLAASQLNRMPAEERPFVMLPTMNATVTDWIDDSEPLVVPTPNTFPDTLLSRLATGPRRLWVLASGVFLVFVGLVFGTSPTIARRSATHQTADGTCAASTALLEPVESNIRASVVPVTESVVTEHFDADASSEEYDAAAATVAAVAVVATVAAIADIELCAPAEEIEATFTCETHAISFSAQTEVIATADVVESATQWPDANDRALNTITLFHGLQSALDDDHRDETRSAE